MKVKKVAIVLIISLALIIGIVAVQANSSIKNKAVISNSNLKPGEETTITIELEEADKEINVYKATLEYDKSIFEEVDQSNFVEQNNWENLMHNKNTGEFIAINKKEITKNENVVQITLKVKNDVSTTKTNINIKDVVVSAGIIDIKLDPINIEISIQEEQKQAEITSTKYNIEENKYIARVIPGTTIEEFEKNVTATGNMVFSNKEGEKLQNTDILKTGDILTLNGGLQLTIIVTGDLDGNGKITVTDLAKLKLHCIEKKLLEENELRAADINYDEKITVTDLAQIKLILLEQLELK